MAGSSSKSHVRSTELRPRTKFDVHHRSPRWHPTTPLRPHFRRQCRCLRESGRIAQQSHWRWSRTPLHWQRCESRSMHHRSLRRSLCRLPGTAQLRRGQAPRSVCEWAHSKASKVKQGHLQRWAHTLRRRWHTHPVEPHRTSTPRSQCTRPDFRR